MLLFMQNLFWFGCDCICINAQRSTWASFWDSGAKQPKTPICPRVRLYLLSNPCLFISFCKGPRQTHTHTPHSPVYTRSKTPKNRYDSDSCLECSGDPYTDAARSGHNDPLSKHDTPTPKQKNQLIAECQKKVGGREWDDCKTMLGL